jgi:hypothetical protein
MAAFRPFLKARFRALAERSGNERHQTVRCVRSRTIPEVLGHENRIKSIGNLQDGSNGYYQLVWQVEKKYAGETRHETAMRYIKEAETAQGIEAQRATTVEQGVVHESPVAESDAPDTGVSGLSHTGSDRG